MIKTATARKFARSLIEVIEKEADLETIYNELVALSDLLLGSSESLNFFSNPGIPAERKESAMTEITGKMGCSAVTRSFMFVLLKKRCIGLLKEITVQFLLFIDDVKNRVRGSVTVAEPLDSGEYALLQKKLSDITRKEVVVSVDVDPSIIGGVITKIGSLVIDGSIKNQIKLVQEKLLN